MTAPFSPAWIAAQRWFRAKQRPISQVVERDRAAVEGAVDLRVLEVVYGDGGAPDRYLVLAANGGEPVDGGGAWRSLVAAIAHGAELRGEHGRLVCTPNPALAELLPSPDVAAGSLAERQLRVEQSNTSVVLGDRLILKLFRLVEAGPSPDLEIGAFLADAGFADTPAVAGSIIYRPDRGEPASAAMLQELVATRGDAWAVMLDALASEPSRGIAEASTIGALTASMHAALASRPDLPDFPARPAGDAETAEWRASAERQLAGAVASLGGGDQQRLVALAPSVTARFADTFGSATGEAPVTRIHGDYHLGQILARTDGGYSVIDFEGEPARPLDERRRPSSPLRDVAGLLRSLDYAARSAEQGRHAPGFDAEAWLAEARAAFVAAYGGIGPHEQGLLDAFELEKACYEVRYEANNRPAWLWLPLAAVERLAR